MCFLLESLQTYVSFVHLIVLRKGLLLSLSLVFNFEFCVNHRNQLLALHSFVHQVLSFNYAKFLMIWKYTIICLMALIALFFIHLLIIKLNYADDSLSPRNRKWSTRGSSTKTGLYSAEDKVFQLTTFNFNENVYNSSSAWVVQFYNSWCGHCIKFSPIWKELAADIYSKFCHSLYLTHFWLILDLLLKLDDWKISSWQQKWMREDALCIVTSTSEKWG